MINKNTIFYRLLEQQAEYAVQASSLFLSMTTDFGNAASYIEKIDTIEHEADVVRHDLSKRVDEAFITPMDKEDISALADKLDDVTDCIEAATGRILIYDIVELRPDILPMVQNLSKMTKRLYDAVFRLNQKPDRNQMQDIFIDIHQIENETDEMFRGALGKLFKTMRDKPVDIMIWKEIYDRVERAVDKCEDAANVVESMVVKYA